MTLSPVASAPECSLCLSCGSASPCATLLVTPIKQQNAAMPFERLTITPIACLILVFSRNQAVDDIRYCLNAICANAPAVTKEQHCAEEPETKQRHSSFLVPQDMEQNCHSVSNEGKQHSHSISDFSRAMCKQYHSLPTHRVIRHECVPGFASKNPFPCLPILPTR